MRPSTMLPVGVGIELNLPLLWPPSAPEPDAAAEREGDAIKAGEES